MSQTRDDFTATEIKAGILVLASLAILLGFIISIRGCSVHEPAYHTLYTHFTDVGGLDAGATVRFGGVKVGKVTAVELDPDDAAKIRVVARVRAEVPVNAASIASIEQISLTAEKHLEISTGDGAKPRLEDGATVPSTGVASGLFDVPDVDGVIARLEGLLEDVDTLLGVDRAQRAAADGGPEFVDLARLSATVDSALRTTTDAVSGLQSFVTADSGGAHEVVERLLALEKAASELVAELHAAVAENREPMAQVVANLARLSDTAATRIDELSATLESGLASLGDAGGAASDLLAGQRPVIEELLANLEHASRNLRELSRTLADNPAALIRGAEPAGRVVKEGR